MLYEADAVLTAQDETLTPEMTEVNNIYESQSRGQKE